MTTNSTIFDRVIAGIKNNRFFSFILIPCFLFFALANFTDSIDKFIQFGKKYIFTTSQQPAILEKKDLSKQSNPTITAKDKSLSSKNPLIEKQQQELRKLATEKPIEANKNIATVNPYPIETASKLETPIQKNPNLENSSLPTQASIKAEEKNISENADKELIKSLKNGLKHTNSYDVATLLINTIPKIHGGISCHDLVDLMSHGNSYDTVKVFKTLKHHIKRPFEIDCFEKIGTIGNSYEMSGLISDLVNSPKGK